MRCRLSFWKVLAVTAVILSFAGSSQIVWAGYRAKNNNGYLYVRSGQATVKAKARLREKAARKKAPRIRKKRPPKMKWVNIYFESGKAEVNSPGTFRLNRAARLLKINSQKEVVIIGSADRRGSAEVNYSLALKRAKAVKNYLINRGINPKRLTLKSIGKKGASTEPGLEALARDRSAKFQIILAGRKKKSGGK